MSSQSGLGDEVYSGAAEGVSGAFNLFRS